MAQSPNEIPSAREIRAISRAAPGNSSLNAARGILKKLENRFDREALDALFEAVADKGADWIKASSRSPAALYLRAKFLSSTGEANRAADAWSQFFNSSPTHDPLILLQFIQVLVGMNNYLAAAQELRKLFRTQPSYSIHARAERLVRKVWEHCPPQLRQCRIAILGSSTTSLLIPILQNLCFRDGINAEFYEAPYGNFRQEILDHHSGIHTFKPNVAFLITHWRDLQLSPVSADESSQLARMAEEFKNLWRKLFDDCGCHIVHNASDFSIEDSYANLSNTVSGGRNRLIALLNLQLAKEAPGYVSILDTPSLVTEVGMENWANPSFWYSAKQHPAPKALPHLAEYQIAHVRALLGLTKKVVVCDLDNTLWGGIIGEDGLQGIRIGSSSPEGEAFADFQRYLLDLKSRGVMLAACSKNNPEDAKLPFMEHKQMVLRLGDFAAFAVNWKDKAANIKDIAAQLSLGLDSFVFLDDNPMERAWVHSQLPEVEVIDLNRSPLHRIHDLHKGQYFFSLKLTEEDQKRGDLYHVEAMRESARSSSGSLDEFLRKLDMRATVSPITADNIARVTQLTNKTNQFNLTTRRYTQAEIERLIAKDYTWKGVFQLEDRFGDHGIIGVIFCVPGRERDSWEIDLWLMSCRVLGRQMEDFMFDRLLEAARSAGIKELIGVFHPTAKNSQVADLYSRFGFKELKANPPEKRFVLMTDSVRKPRTTFIQNQNPSGTSEKVSVPK